MGRSWVGVLGPLAVCLALLTYSSAAGLGALDQPDGGQMVSFEVDTVEPAKEPLPTQTLGEALAGIAGGQLLASDSPDRLVVRTESAMHPLVEAVHLAFAEHRQLVLSPDAIWTTIAQGFAQHINQNAELLRERFVSHQGKLTLEVTRDSEDPIRPEEWPGLVEGFGHAIREHVGPGLHRLFVNDFSTTGPVERTVGEIVLMDAYQCYFDYLVECICGIPRVTLLGTVEDWRSIRRRVDVLAEYGLEQWVDRLAPICDQLVASAEGNVDRDFWQCIYKPQEAYGGEVVTGWIGRLFPYLEGNGSLDWNWTFETDDQEPTRQPRSNLRPSVPRSEWIGPGIDASTFPLGLSRAPVRLQTTQGFTCIEFLGGLVAVSQDTSTLALRPELGWAIREDAAETRLARIRERSTPDAAWAEKVMAEDESDDVDEIPAELLRMLGPLGGASIFDGAWRLRTDETLRRIPYPEEYNFFERMVHFLDISEGRRLAYIQVREKWPVVLVQKENLASPRSLPVIAESINALFDRALEEGPGFFDAPAFEPLGTLKDWL